MLQKPHSRLTCSPVLSLLIVHVNPPPASAPVFSACSGGLQAPAQQAGTQEWPPAGAAGDAAQQLEQRQQLMTSILADEDQLISAHRIQAPRRTSPLIRLMLTVLC